MTAAELLPIVYDELRRQAALRLARIPPGQTLQPTALVHEAYLRLVGPHDPGWDNRRHFYAAAGRAMRDILVEQARRKSAAKRGGDRRRLELSEATMWIEPPLDDVVALDEALRRLEQRDPRAAELVVLRYFAGASEVEAAAALGVSMRTVRRDWSYARAWLHREMSTPEGRGDGADSR